MTLNFNLIEDNPFNPLPIEEGKIKKRKGKPKQTYQEEMRTAITSVGDLNHYFKTNLNDSKYKIFIPKKFAKKIKLAGVSSSLWKQFIPNDIESNEEIQNQGLLDPIGDKVHKKDGPLIHRYKNRVLFFPTSICPINCRYCFRKNELNANPEFFNKNYKKALDYIKTHKEINEIIFSGGDPFILNDEKMTSFLEDFSNIAHIKYIRFHTRTPIILPSRITSNFIKILKNQRARILIVIHTNHLEEIDLEVEVAIKKLQKTNASLLSQSVLLKGVNDDVKTLFNLVEKLQDLKVRPYYLHHPDRVKGAMHFYLPLEQGRKIYSQLKSQLSGWACPQYIIDIPGGEGKTSAFNPESFTFSGTLINKDSKPILY